MSSPPLDLTSAGAPDAAQSALGASELSYRRLFESAQDGILILDAETGRISEANPFLTTLLGFTLPEMMGKTVGELSPFKDIVSNQAMLERLQAVRYVRYEELPLTASCRSSSQSCPICWTPRACVIRSTYRWVK